MSDLIQSQDWAIRAFRELMRGFEEISGPQASQRIIQYFHDLKLEPSDGDETPWCAVGLNWCLHVEGIEHTGKANARSFLTYGREVGLKRGAICTLWRVARDDWRGHVGIVTGWSEGTVSLLGGNQGNTWSIKTYSREKILANRWPTLDQMIV